ncbi:MAG: HAD-IC family P-type ATPase, partial [Verrucomicrobiales bacterium]|nr:HAD-IC family P-type ATPase [Verrucomicrobiales bacterium]
MNRPSIPVAARTQSSPRDWHGRAALDVLRELGSTPEGLSASEAARRLALQGPNEITAAKPAGALQMVLAQFRGLIIWVLIAAGIVSGILGELVDCIAILAIVLLNAGIGFTLEFRADRSIAALRKWSAPRANVRRDGRVLTIPAVEFVTGDILVLEAGDLIAADARVLEAASLRCMEAALTGESVPVAKVNHVLPPGTVPLGDRKNMVFTGTAVTAGTGRAVVVSVAMHTELGRIAVLIEEAGAETKTPLQKKLDTVGRRLVWATLGVVVLLFALGVMRGSNAVDLFMTSVSLAVAAVPEGLPAVVTVALALGVLRMSRRRALIRKLPAVETLGATSVICTDKTGTLTVGEMTVRKLQIAGFEFEVDGEGYGPAGGVRPAATATMDPTRTAALRELASHLVACNNAHLVEEAGVWKVIGDPTEGALLAAGRKAGVDREQVDREWPKQHENPFDSDRKRSSMIRRMPDGHRRAFVNGAPDALLPLCTHLLTPEGVRLMTEADRREILARNAAMGHQALRVLGTAHRDLGPLPTPPAGIPPTSPPALDGDGDGAAPLGPASVERDLVFV